MPRLKLIIAYVGTEYSGWQVQRTKDKPHPITVQGLIEKQLSRICEIPISTMGSGRTDAGVHADCQVAHCDIPESKSKINWQLALNTSLPSDIRIKNYAIVHDDFHSLYDVEKKAYTYRLWLDKTFMPPKIYPYVWNCGSLDLDKIDEAIPYLMGKHDFASMQNSGSSIKTTVRTIYTITRSPVSSDPSNHEIQLYFEANGFLRQMVRNLTGLLVACGRHKIKVEDIPYILEQDKRVNIFTAAPARGLSMSGVWYKDGTKAHE